MKFYAQTLIILLLLLGCKGVYNLPLKDDISNTENINIEIVNVDAKEGVISYVISNDNDIPYWLNTNKIFWKLRVRNVQEKNIKRRKIIEQGVLPINAKKFVLIPQKSQHKISLKTNFLSQYMFESDDEYLLETEYFNTEKYGDQPTVLGKINSNIKRFDVK